MKKKMLVLLLVAVLMLNLSACGSSDSTETKPAKNNDTTVIQAPPKETEAPAAPLSDSGKLGDVEVSIGELEHVQDYFGDPAILIHFTFTNNSEENQSAMFSINFTAFQNGIGLKDATILDDSVYNSSDLSKEVQPGATIELAKAYTPSSDTAPIEVIVTESISFDDTKLGKSFEIAPGGETVFSTAPGFDTATEIDRYAVSINSYNISEDRNGNKVLILNMGYTNNSNSDTPFYAALNVKAFQGGIELEKSYFIDDSVMDDSGNYLNVLPGAGLGVAEGFTLTDENALVDIEITPSFSFGDDKVTTQINPAE